MKKSIVSTALCVSMLLSMIGAILAVPISAADPIDTTATGTYQTL